MFKKFLKKISKKDKDKDKDKDEDKSFDIRVLEENIDKKSLDDTIKILIVDDADINRYVLKRYIEIYKKQNDTNIQIDEASNGVSCVEKCKTVNYDIVFMDLIMPFMGGIEAAKKILEGKNKSPVIIGLTGQIEQNTQVLIRESGMKYCIHKPVDISTIHSLLEIFFLNRK